MIQTIQIKTLKRLADYLESPKRDGLAKLVEWLNEATWDLDKKQDPEGHRLAYEIKLTIDELAGVGKGDARLIARLRHILNNVSFHPSPRSGTRGMSMHISSRIIEIGQPAFTVQETCVHRRF